MTITAAEVRDVLGIHADQHHTVRGPLDHAKVRGTFDLEAIALYFQGRLEGAVAAAREAHDARAKAIEECARVAEDERDLEGKDFCDVFSPQDAYIDACNDIAADRITALEAENARLRRAVEKAFLEGFDDGVFAGGGNAWSGAAEDCWLKSAARTALSQAEAGDA